MAEHPWDKPPNQIASEIADQFFPVTSLSNAELRRLIMRQIEAEREIATHYMHQMGRWVARAKLPRAIPRVGQSHTEVRRASTSRTSQPRATTARGITAGGNDGSPHGSC